MHPGAVLGPADRRARKKLVLCRAKLRVRLEEDLRTKLWEGRKGILETEGFIAAELEYAFKGQKDQV